MIEPSCVDLRPWAESKRYRWRFEESYKAERAEYRGDGRWYVEVPCRYGLIYPYGGETLLAYATRGVKRHNAELPGVRHHQYDDGAEVFKFPVEQLEAVAAILRPKRLPGRSELTDAQRETLQKYAFRGGQATIRASMSNWQGRVRSAMIPRENVAGIAGG